MGRSTRTTKNSKAKSRLRYYWKNSEPVAAASDYYVLAFEHSVHADLVNNNTQGIQAMEQILFNLSGKSLQMVPVPKENWQDIREEFLKLDQTEKNRYQKEDPLIDEAIKNRRGESGRNKKNNYVGGM
ncbi:hypothetical protein GCM10020331_019340 [Ectobacillus funiculus]